MLGPVPGALYVAVLFTATIFGIAAGTVGATVAVVGIMAAPAMTRAGYSARLSAGAITAGGSLGILIPPSVMLVVMGPMMGVSVIELYAASFGPGFLLAGLFPWQWFANTVASAPGIYLGNATLVKRTALPRMLLPVASATTTSTVRNEAVSPTTAQRRRL